MKLRTLRWVLCSGFRCSGGSVTKLGEHHLAQSYLT